MYASFRGLQMFSKLVSLPCMKNLVRVFCPLLFLLVVTGYAQEPFKTRPSPLALTNMRFKDAYVKITYSQPQAKGREIFGKLVPFGQVWRTGANENTEITLTKDMLVNNQLLKAGTYSIFSIPEADKWTIIFNSDVGQWGAYNYNATLNILKFEVPVTRNTDSQEAFTIFLDQKNEMADLLIMWDNIKVSVPFRFIN